MKFNFIFFISLFLLTFSPAQAVKPSKSVHKEMHSQLLADAGNSLDRSVVQDYLKIDVESRESFNSQYGDLSEESVAMINDLLSEAKTHCGKKYVYGSKGPNTFDCSGFTGYVYKQFGYKLNASSRGQYTEGQPVNKGELRPGDLVFFTSARSKGGVGHVGIVVTADNENNSFTFIHAAISNGIEVQKSTAPYYSKRYVGARRIITE